ncbi:MAG: twin-arginine translocase subunit TatC [Deltaproteobacteria bacterium HGW-Deltaproteobacteria-6]|jgi:sec-independent protein translocase protein TatC|nr:MAG: twin-arginine translocase subunit TatC [Deltaproteobacteria bacterium HGW-Deltaproteobacteria-6]
MESNEDLKMSLTEHLIELRKRLTNSLIALGLGFFVCYYFKDWLFGILTKPLTDALPKSSYLIYTGLTQAFFTYMKIAFFASLIITSPFIIYQVWKFISPALLPEEKKMVVPFVFFSTLLFLSGVTFGYFIVLPTAFEFFVSFNNQYLRAMISFSDYLSFLVTFLLGFGLSFQLPILIFFLARLGIVTDKLLSRNRKYAILVIFVIAAVLTPSPDALSQILMAIPLMFLYEVSIFVARFAAKKKEAPESNEGEPEE